MKRLIGRPPIHPVLFYSGKFSGYILWILLWIAVIDSPASLGSSFHDLTASALLVAGLPLIVISLLQLGKSTRLGIPEEDTSLKTAGLYRLSRNPMYAGFNLWTLSAMILLHTPAALVLGCYSLWTYHRIILGEEQFLQTRFGEDFTTYRNRVRRYL